MAPRFGPRQQGTVSHRMHFWGRPAGPSTVSWDYESMPWEIVRPDNGLPAARQSMRCKVCDKELTFTVYSVMDAYRRVARRAAVAWAGLGALAVGVVLLLSGVMAAGVVLVIVGPLLGLVFGMAAADDVGIGGHGNGFAVTNAKHSVGIEDAPYDLPDLTCEKCGHTEDFPRAAYFRDDFVEEQYEAAKHRFARHICRPRPSTFGTPSSPSGV